MMTKKRFIADNKYVMQNGQVWVVCGGEHSADVVSTALNELSDENERLKQREETLLNEIEDFQELLSKLDKENQELDEKVCLLTLDLITTKSYKQLEKEFNRFKKKNEQLKKENKHLRCTIESNSQDDYIDYLEKQNERLKETITELASNDKILFMTG